MPDCAISTDIITGFSTETDEEHRDTLNMMQKVGYDYAYMFKYSERPKTLAERRYDDDIPDDIKTRRLQEIIELQTNLSRISNEADLGKTFEVLVEGPSRKSDADFCGRNSQNKMIVFPKKNAAKGSYVMVKVTSCTSATLIGELVE
jgi:tRNA-2-methylthio-N6-dimethylallyladenosine synthase